MRSGPQGAPVRGEGRNRPPLCSGQETDRHYLLCPLLLWSFYAYSKAPCLCSTRARAERAGLLVRPPGKLTQVPWPVLS